MSILVFSFPVGYASLLPLKKYINENFATKLPLYLGLGFILNSVWMFSISSFTLDPLVMFSLFIISITIIFYQTFIRKSVNFDVSQKDFGSFLIKKVSKENSYSQFLLLTVFFLPLILFIIIVDHFQLPILDSDIKFHSFLTDSIIEQGRMAIFFSEIESVPLHFQGTSIAYPEGWHVVNAVYTIFNNLTSIKMAFSLISVTTFLIYGSLLTISYHLTRSIWLAIASMGGFFFIPLPIIDYQLYLYGTFVAGLGPAQFGFLVLTTSLSLTLITSQKNNQTFFIIIFLLLFAAFIAYPLFIIQLMMWIFLIIFFKYRKNFKNFKNTLSKKNKLKISNLNIPVYLILISIVIGLVIGNIYELESFLIIDNINAEDFPTFAKRGFSLAFAYTENEVFLPFLLVFLVFSLLNLFYIPENRAFTTAIFSIIILSISSSYFGYFEGFFAALRINSLIIPFTWILVAATLKSGSNFIGKLLVKKSSIKFSKYLEFLLFGIFSVVSIIIFYPSLETVLTIDHSGIYHQFP